jgi:hypothetical protein
MTTATTVSDATRKEVEEELNGYCTQLDGLQGKISDAQRQLHLPSNDNYTSPS